MVDLDVVCRGIISMSDDDLANLIALEWSQMRGRRERERFVCQLTARLNLWLEQLGLDAERALAILSKIDNALYKIWEFDKCHSREMQTQAYDMAEASRPGVY